MMPLLDVLQSVPILSFLPVVLLGLSAILPEGVAAELAAIVLIFTSQAWNLTFAWYQSLTTIGKDLREASAIFRFNRWLRLKWLELPSAASACPVTSVNRVARSQAATSGTIVRTAAERSAAPPEKWRADTRARP